MLWNSEADEAWFELMRTNSLAGTNSGSIVCGKAPRLAMAGLTGQTIVASWGDDDDPEEEEGDELDGNEDGLEQDDDPFDDFDEDDFDDDFDDDFEEELEDEYDIEPDDDGLSEDEDDDLEEDIDGEVVPGEEPDFDD
ncbi:MAG: hypothetical protein JNK90_25385 [Planctomycetaceae bacterium]|nr:hypothetical protein [Planctomycetaceae bacterium]MBN8600062.1 hypothetical protein [Planctomycetota bacterium]